jgi:hypothetical protein
MNKLDILSQKIKDRDIHHLLNIKGADKSFIHQLMCNIAQTNNIENHSDVYILETENKNFKVEDLNPVLQFFYHNPMTLKYKILLINEAHKLTDICANKLLKTFEEPPVEAQILLNNPNKSPLIQTIESRAITINLKQALSYESVNLDSVKKMELTEFTNWLKNEPHSFQNLLALILAKKNELKHQQGNVIQSVIKQHNEALKNNLNLNSTYALLFDLISKL